MGPHVTRDCPGYDKPKEWWNTPKAWQTWPGAHLPESAHPPGTNYSHNHVPMYPGGTTCAMLCEQDAHFPIVKDWSFGLLIGIAVLVYMVWPLYVLWHLIRKKSVYGNDERFQANHEAYRAKMGAAAKGKSEMEDE